MATNSTSSFDRCGGTCHSPAVCYVIRRSPSPIPRATSPVPPSPPRAGAPPSASRQPQTIPPRNLARPPDNRLRPAPTLPRSPGRPSRPSNRPSQPSGHIARPAHVPVVRRVTSRVPPNRRRAHPPRSLAPATAGRRNRATSPVRTQRHRSCRTTGRVHGTLDYCRPFIPHIPRVTQPVRAKTSASAAPSLPYRRRTLPSGAPGHSRTAPPGSSAPRTPFTVRHLARPAGSCTSPPRHLASPPRHLSIPPRHLARRRSTRVRPSPTLARSLPHVVRPTSKPPRLLAHALVRP